ncbi:MAG: hypothetical protein NUV77_26660 [Thermoguttaceae bacterium]|nr:hypothetical protein [Thermoguttaceae bacterium]
MTVALTSLRTEYLLGEPVVLIVTLKNTGRSAVLAWVGNFSYAVDLDIGRGEGPLRPYKHPIEIWHDLDAALPLQPGEQKVYVFRMLLHHGAHPGESQLVFAEPGRYRAKATYPLYPICPKGRMVESKTVEFHINPPHGVDAKVWREINRPKFLRFLQSGELRREDGDVLNKALEILRATPETSYRVAIRWALRDYYAHRRYFGLREPDSKACGKLQEICRVLDVPKRAVYSVAEDKYYLLPPHGEGIPGADRLFSGDQRLDRIVNLPPSEFFPLPVVLGTYAIAKHGVPLRVAWPIEEDYELVCDTPIRQTLREFMTSVAVPGTKWVRERDGYMLVPAPQEEPKAGAKQE